MVNNFFSKSKTRSAWTEIPHDYVIGNHLYSAYVSSCAFSPQIKICRGPQKKKNYKTLSLAC